MKKLLIIVAAFALTCSGLAMNTSAEILSNSNPTEVPELTPEELLDLEEPVHEEDASAASVPEPTMFGLIAFGLAVGGGLMVRRKD